MGAITLNEYDMGWIVIGEYAGKGFASICESIAEYFCHCNTSRSSDGSHGRGQSGIPQDGGRAGFGSSKEAVTVITAGMRMTIFISAGIGPDVP